MTSPIEALVDFLSTAPHEAKLYDACRSYTLRCDGDANPNPATNGEFMVLRNAIPGSQLAVDAGAERGVFIDEMLRLNPALAIHAFEPDPRSYATLQAKGYPPSVTLENLALGACEEERDLWLYGDVTELSTLHARPLLPGLPVERPTGSVRVRVTTLDDYCAARGLGRIDFLKIDAEGHDLKILQGARRLLAAGAIRGVQFEFGAGNIYSHDLLQDFFAFFETLPYVLHKIHPEWLARHDRYDNRLESFAYQNWLAVLRG